MRYDRTVHLDTDFATAVTRVREALAEQGFGVLTEIDVTATLKAKLDQGMEDYVILGACNPPLAHRALQADRTIGLLLPCNVVVRADGDRTAVQALDPQTMVALTGLEALRPVAEEDDAETGGAGEAGDDRGRSGQQQRTRGDDHQDRDRAHCGAADQPGQTRPASGRGRNRAAYRSASRTTGADSTPACRASRTIPA